MHDHILREFERLFPEVKYSRWWKKGANGVRLRLVNGMDVVFVFKNKKSTIESLELYDQRTGTVSKGK